MRPLQTKPGGFNKLYVAGITRTLFSKGYAHTFSTVYRALPWFLHINGHLKLCRVMTSNPHLIELTRRRPQLIYKYLGSYLARNFPVRNRLAILTNHYHFLATRAKADFFSLVLNQTIIWRQTVDEDEFTIRLEFPAGIDFDGDLALVFSCNDIPVYAVSFTFVPASVIDGSSGQVLFVSRVQGISSFDVIRQATKKLYDITPASLLVVALQGIGLAFGIDKLVGISNDMHLYRYTRVNETHFFDYDSFWRSFHVDSSAVFFHIPIPFVEKPLAELKPNHRSRTIRKRAYKGEVCETVEQYVRTNFLPGVAVTADFVAHALS